LSEIWPVIAILFVVLLQLNLTKLKLDYLKSGFKLKKKDINIDEKVFISLEFDFFEFSLSLLLEYGR